MGAEPAIWNGAGPAAGGTAARPRRRKGWTMNRYVVSMALTLFLAGGEAVAGQTVARVDYRGAGLGVSVAIGDLPVRVRPHASAAVGWAAVDWGPVRLWVSGGYPVWHREVLDKQDLRFILGKETVRRIEWHARDMGVRGPLEGRWYRLDRFDTMLDVSVRGVPVAELYDYGSDGIVDRIFLIGPRARVAAPAVVYRAPTAVYRAPEVVRRAPEAVRRAPEAVRYKEVVVKRGRGNGKKK